MTKKQITYILATSAILLSCILYTVFNSSKESLQIKDYQDISKDKLIRVALQNNDAEVNIHSDSISGMFYDQIKSFANSKGLEIELNLLASIDEAIEGLKQGRYDIIASKVPINALTKEDLLLSTPIYKSREMLIQRKNDSTSIKSILQLSNKTIHIEKNSPAKLRIANICKEIGDTIYTQEIDLYGEEHLIFLVAHGDIDYAVCNENVAKSHKDSLQNIDFDTPLGFTQLYSFATNKQSKALIDTLNAWIEKTTERKR